MLNGQSHYSEEVLPDKNILNVTLATLTFTNLNECKQINLNILVMWYSFLYRKCINTKMVGILISNPHIYLKRTVIQFSRDQVQKQ